MTTKKSFLLHIDSLDVLDHLTDEQCGKLIKAFKAYHLGEDIDLSGLLKIAFVPFENQFKRDLETYENVCNRNRNNGLKGGRPKNPKNPVGILETQDNPEKPKKADSDNKKDNDSDNDSSINKPSPKSVNGVPYQKIVDLYHEILPTLPKIEKLTATRKSQIRQRWLQSDLPDLNNWENYFDYISQSKFLMGMTPPNNGQKPFKATLEWLTKEGNFVKVTEGNYHG